MPHDLICDPASNVSEGRVRTRLLGSSRMIEAEVRHTWIAAANNIKGTSEILRRMVMIELDAKTPNPEKRSGFRHADLEAWVNEHRPELVWAILTLVQNWIAKGMKPWSGKAKASFEAWSRVMGGILRDAEIRGFLENEDRLRSYGATGGDSGIEVFIQHLAERHASGASFRAGGTSEFRGRKGDPDSSIMNELNIADDGTPLLLDGWGSESLQSCLRTYATGQWKVLSGCLCRGLDSPCRESCEAAQCSQLDAHSILL
jgi:hypothetical protein